MEQFFYFDDVAFYCHMTTFTWRVTIETFFKSDDSTSTHFLADHKSCRLVGYNNVPTCTPRHTWWHTTDDFNPDGIGRYFECDGCLEQEDIYKWRIPKMSDSRVMQVGSAERDRIFRYKTPPPPTTTQTWTTQPCVHSLSSTHYTYTPDARVE